MDNWHASHKSVLLIILHPYDTPINGWDQKGAVRHVARKDGLILPKTVDNGKNAYTGLLRGTPRVKLTSEWGNLSTCIHILLFQLLIVENI